MLETVGGEPLMIQLKEKHKADVKPGLLHKKLEAREAQVTNSVSQWKILVFTGGMAVMLCL